MGFRKWLGISSKKTKEIDKAKKVDDMDKSEIAQNINEDELLEYIDSDTEEQIGMKENFYPGYLVLTKEEIMILIKDYLPQKYDKCLDVRSDKAYKKGGTACLDQAIVKKYRGVAKELIKIVGKQIITGKFNLTTIGCPIKIMISKSNLESIIGGTAVFPMLINKAAQSTDIFNRFILVMVAVLSSFFYTNEFFKPLNPILGETLQASYADGSTVYAEQISHHPPISYFLVYGPNNSYLYSGYYFIEVKAGLNSMNIINKGTRKITFNNHTPQTIQFGFPYDQYSGTFFGTTRVESLGKILFEDKVNQISCEIKFGKQKGKPSDYFSGDMMYLKKNLGKLHGTYLGYIDFNETRYWQHNESCKPFRVEMQQQQLPSDHLLRGDLIELRKGNIEKAQNNKNNLEAVQRKDALLRKEFKKKSKKK